MSSYNDRDNTFASTEFQGKVRIALTDWLNYWATNGTAEIEDPDLRAKTDLFIKFATSNIDHYSRNLSTLVIGDDGVKQADTITDAVVSTGVTHVLSTALDYLI